jgi:GNAT superfamily N-acetyltransferase
MNIKSKYGYCSYSFECKEHIKYVHIYNLFIFPKYRKCGNARIILQRTINQIRKRGYNGKIKIVANPKEEGIDKKRLMLFYRKMKLDVYSYYG